MGMEDYKDGDIYRNGTKVGYKSGDYVYGNDGSFLSEANNMLGEYDNRFDTFDSSLNPTKDPIKYDNYDAGDALPSFEVILKFISFCGIPIGLSYIIPQKLWPLWLVITIVLEVLAFTIINKITKDDIEVEYSEENNLQKFEPDEIYNINEYVEENNILDIKKQKKKIYSPQEVERIRKAVLGCTEYKDMFIHTLKAHKYIMDAYKREDLISIIGQDMYEKIVEYHKNK